MAEWHEGHLLFDKFCIYIYISKLLNRWIDFNLFFCHHCDGIESDVIFSDVIFSVINQLERKSIHENC
jgi:hypothetical protein